MSGPTRVPGARLVCVSIAEIHRHLNAPPMAGFYRILWELEATAPALKDQAVLQRMAHHYLQGKVICAN